MPFDKTDLIATLYGKGVEPHVAFLALCWKNQVLTKMEAYAVIVIK